MHSTGMESAVRALSPESQDGNLTDDQSEAKTEEQTGTQIAGCKRSCSVSDPDPSCSTSGSAPKAQRIEQRDARVTDTVFSQTPSVLSAEKTHKVTLLTSENFAGTVCSELQRFLSSDDREKLNEITLREPEGDGYQKILTSLLEDRCQLKSYYLADTCNALYWGLMYGRLTPEEFQQHYYSLMIIVFFSPAACQGPKPPGVMDLESVIKLVSLDQLDLSEYPEESRAEMNLLKSRLSSPDVFEISFPDGFRERLAEMDQDLGSLIFDQEEFL